jgi:formylglycine-generating enzyme required for sulfatase activity
MVEVPAGEFTMGDTWKNTRARAWPWEHEHPKLLTGIGYETPQLLVDLPTFEIDQFEVTNARYRRCVEAGVCRPATGPFSDHPEEYATDPRYGDYPVHRVTWYDAATYCRWVDKRLPTEVEWEKAARGTDGQAYPWGNEWDPARLSLELEPVGSHPTGASPYGVQDVLDITGEWTADPFCADYLGCLEGEITPRGEDVMMTVRGWMPSPQVFTDSSIFWVTYRWPSRLTDQADSFVGFRCARGPTPPPSLEEALVRVQLPSQPSPETEVDLSDMAYVPAGPFLMGNNQLYTETTRMVLRTTPAHVVDLDAFYVDRYEVTWAEYARFLNVLGNAEQACDGHGCADVNYPDLDSPATASHILFQDGRYAVEPGYENSPADTVSWYGAEAYCEWVGKRLPTEAEWEKAARGTDGRRYPWGDEWDERTRAGESGERDVGSDPIDVSPYGVYDMLGNAGEWVADWYTENYYVHSPERNPRGPLTGRQKVIRTYSWNPAICYRFFDLPDSTEGFRCAYSIQGD